MRRDMKDLLLDTGRNGGYGKADSRRARLKRLDPDDTPSFVSSARRRQEGHKEQGDRLRPLKAYLEANCGRLWDDVYREICEFADPRTIRGYHLRQHVWQYVLPNNYNIGHRRSFGPFFVDDDGTLQMERPKTDADYARERAAWAKKAKRKGWKGLEEPKAPNPHIRIDADHYYEKIEGFWFAFETKHYTYKCSVEDLVEEDGVIKIVRIPRKDVHQEVTTKKQVNGKTQRELDRRVERHPKRP